MKFLWFLTVLLTATVTVRAQVPVELKHTILSPSTGRQGSTSEGWCVATDGDIIATGVPSADGAVPIEGLVRVYSASTGALLQTLKEPESANDSRFGTVLAVSGSRVVVMSNTSPKAYVYDISSATPTQPVFVLSHPSLGQIDLPTRSVAIEGDRVVIGVPLSTTVANGSGSVYVYDLSRPNPSTPALTIENPTQLAWANFGRAVSISGTRIAVGAPGAFFGALGMGIAYVYDVATATPTTPVSELRNPNTAQQTRFGASVGISENRVVVGAYEEDLGAENAGGAFLFDLQGATPTIPVATLSSPQPGINNWYGYSVVISGTRVVIGGTSTRVVGVYDFTSAALSTPVVQFANPDPNSPNYYGISVAVSGARVVVGAQLDDIDGVENTGSAYVYNVSTATPATPVYVLSSPHPTSGDYFGLSTALSGDYMVVGALYDDLGGLNAGAAYVYNLNSAAPSAPILTLQNPSPNNLDSFGAAVSVSGTRAVIGAYGDDAGDTDSGVAYVYDFSGAEPSKPILTLPNPTPGYGDEFGRAVAISGSLVVVGAYNDDGEVEDSGAVYVYNLNSATPSTPIATLRSPVPSSGSGFGRAVAIDGTRVLVGAYGDDTGARDAGTVFVFDMASATPTEPVAILNNPQPSSGDYFGWSVAIHGNFVAVGAILDDATGSDSGIAYVYDLSGLTPNVPVSVLNNPTPGAGDYFGYSVAIFEGRVVVGAMGDGTANNRPGIAYLYHLGGSTPATPVAVINNPRPSNFDNFGSSVAFDGKRIVVGSYSEDSPTVDKGAAYVFDSTDTFTQVPRIVGPAEDSYTKGPVSISFMLFEKAQAGSVKLKLTKETSEWLLTLSSAMESAGTHTVTLNLADPAASTGVVAATGGAIPDGFYKVAVVNSDAAGNPLAQSVGRPITIDTTAPTLASVRIESSNSSLGWAREEDFIRVDVEANELIKKPTIQIGGQSVPVSGGSKLWNATLQVTDLAPAEGPVEISISYEDFAGNVGSIVTTTTNGSSVRVDRTPPVLTLPSSQTVLAPDLSGVAVTYQIGATDNSGTNPQITTFPPSGSVFPLGTSVVTVNAVDAAGNSVSGQFEVVVWLENPLQNVLFAKGSPVPGAGEPNSKIPAGATWSTFGTPSLVGSVEDKAATGFLATVSAPTGTLNGIFSGPEDAPVARVITGELVPNVLGQSFSGVTFASFRDPVFAGADHFAFSATIAGPGVTKSNDTGIWAGSVGSLREVAREGAPMPGAEGIKFSAFTSVLMHAPGRVYFTATLKGPGVNAKNDFSLWFWTEESGLQLVQREGTPSTNPAFTELVKSFVALAPVNSSAGHGRYDSEFVGGLFKFANGAQALVNFDGHETINDGLWTGVELSPGVKARSFGIPCFLPDDSAYSVRAELEPAGAGKKTTPALLRDGAVIAKKGDAVSIVDLGDVKIADLSDPVTNVGSDGTRMDLFLARVSGAKVKAGNDQGLWSYSGEVPAINLVAREGAEAPGCAGAKFKSFTSFSVMTDRGPLFTATLQGGTPLLKRGSDAGLWGTDYAGTTRLLLRNGQEMGGRTVKSFDVLGTISGSPAQQRAWSDEVTDAVITRCFFTDGSQAIVKVIIP